MVFITQFTFLFNWTWFNFLIKVSVFPTFWFIIHAAPSSIAKIATHVFSFSKVLLGYILNMRSLLLFLLETMHNIFLGPDELITYFIFSRSHPFAFSIDGNCQCLILCGNSETDSQLWMKELRHFLWPKTNVTTPTTSNYWLEEGKASRKIWL